MEDIITQITEEINQYYEQGQIKKPEKRKWKAVGNDETRAFLGVVIVGIISPLVTFIKFHVFLK